MCFLPTPDGCPVHFQGFPVLQKNVLFNEHGQLVLLFFGNRTYFALCFVETLVGVARFIPKLMSLFFSFILIIHNISY